MKRIIPILILTVFFSCNNNDEANNCEEIACTLEFRTIVVHVENPGGIPVALDDFKVINQENQMDITREVSVVEFEMMQENGTYSLFGDEFTQEYQNKEIEIQFIGIIDGEEIVRSDYKVGADCCHVYFVSGNLTLIIE